jgi:hypothetical protein
MCGIEVRTLCATQTCYCSSRGHWLLVIWPHYSRMVTNQNVITSAFGDFHVHLKQLLFVLRCVGLWIYCMAEIQTTNHITDVITRCSKSSVSYWTCQSHKIDIMTIKPSWIRLHTAVCASPLQIITIENPFIHVWTLYIRTKCEAGNGLVCEWQCLLLSAAVCWNADNNLLVTMN